MSDTTGLEIAIIGMSGRFPGARTLDRFWRNLRDGIESIRFFSDEELLSAGIDTALLRNPNYVKARAVLDDVEGFDADFFGFTPLEARVANPQQRLFLECAWEALESAGYPPTTHDLPTGVFAAAGTNSYGQGCQRLVERGAVTPFLVGVGNDKEHLASRVSYKLDLRGPALVVHTACSSALVAVHLACQGLLAGDCDMAIAGGAHVTVPPGAGYLFEEGTMYSRDGRCRSFDARAGGAGRGDGVGVVVLKRLADALTAHDHVAAVIKGSAVTNDGGLKIGYTAPGVAGQMNAIRSAQTLAGVDADTIGYVECHGSGTLLGDPIEIAALSKVFAAATEWKRRCAVGSIKSSIGHLDVAGGIAGLIKTVLALQHGMIPPSLHFTEPNPGIDFDESPFHVATTLEPWPVARPRRAAVNSFGLGGTNAHLVLEEAPDAAAPPRETTTVLIPVSAPAPDALDRLSRSLADYVRAHGDIDLGDIAYTLQAGRKHFACRRTVVAREDGRAGVHGALAHSVLRDSYDSGAPPAVIFVFHGLGTHRTGWGVDVSAAPPIVGQMLDRVAASPALARDDAEGTLFAIELALATLWMEWCVQPEAMCGYGVGEYVAATLAEVMTPEDALLLISARRRFQEHQRVEVFRRESAAVSLRPPRLRYVSSVTRTWIEPADVIDLDYWGRHANHQPPPLDIFDAIVPARGRELLDVPGTSGIRRDDLLAAAGCLWSKGIHLNWRAIGAPRAGRRIPLPTYPFERKRYWFDDDDDPIAARQDMTQASATAGCVSERGV